MTSKLLALLLAVASLEACGEARRSPADRGRVEASMAALGTVRALHHEADVYEGAGQFAQASQAMRRVLDLRLPQGFDDAENVRADAWGRLAELDLRREAPDEALAHVDEGLGVEVEARRGALVERVGEARGREDLRVGGRRTVVGVPAFVRVAHRTP